MKSSVPIFKRLINAASQIICTSPSGKNTHEYDAKMENKVILNKLFNFHQKKISNFNSNTVWTPS